MRAAVLVFLAILALGGARAQAERPQTLTWGAYSVTVTPRPEKDYDKTATAVIKQGSKTLVTLRDWSIEASLKALRPGGPPELLLTAYSGGAHCCTTYYAFTQDSGSLQNLFILDAGNYGANFTDLNGDGTLEAVFGSDTFAYYDYSFAASPATLYVLGCDGVRFADLTRRYAYVPGQEAARALKNLTRPLGKDEDPNETRRSALVGYYSNAVVAGDGAAAEQILNRQVFPAQPALKGWFAAHRSELLSLLYDDPGGRLSISDARTLPEKKDPDQP